MPFMWRRVIFGLLASAVLTAPAAAQYPIKQIVVMVPFAAAVPPTWSCVWSESICRAALARP